jgi:hypothetical protein
VRPHHAEGLLDAQIKDAAHAPRDVPALARGAVVVGVGVAASPHRRSLLPAQEGERRRSRRR